MNLVSLKEVARVFGGYRPTPKATPRVSRQRDQRLLESQDVAAGRRVQWTSLQTLDADVPTKYLLRSEDVLVQLRGARAVSTPPETPPCAVVVSHRFAIVRPNPRVLLPGFLGAVFRHPETQARIQASSRRSTSRFLSLAELRKLMVYVPPLDVQQKIARVDGLRMKFHELRGQHEDLVNQAIDAAVSKAMRA